MDDIRLKKTTITADGREWTVVCNMNVLADVQEAHGGNLVEALEAALTHPLKTALEFAAAMINDAADAAGEDVRYTPSSLGRAIPAARPGEFSDRIMALVWAALDIGGDKGKEDKDEKQPAPEDGAGE